MRAFFLGTGPASGWPAYGKRTRKRRRPSTYAFQCHGTNFFVDVGSWEAALEGSEVLGRVDAVFLSHAHVDHWGGINFFRWGPELPTYSARETFEHPYFKEIKDAPFSLALQEVRPFEEVEVGKAKVTPFPLSHSVPAVGYLIECGVRVAYALDTKWLPQESLEFLKGSVDYLIVDSALPKGEKGAHNTYSEALALGKELGAKVVFAVHLLPSVKEEEVLEEGEALGVKVVVPDDSSSFEL